MKFSVVITTYNRLSLLKRAIKSVLNQTKSCEIIVIDNGSSDGTDTYVQGLGEQVIFWRNPNNQGHSKAMNIGVQLAQGDWIKPLDDDDYLAPNCLEIMLKAIKKHPQAVICSCQAKQINLNGHEICQTPKIGTADTFYIPQADIHYGMLLEQVPFGTTSQVAFQKNAFLTSKGWDLSLDICDDIDSWIRIAQFGDAIFINSCLTYRTLWSGGNNHKSSVQKRLETNISMKEKIYKLVDKSYHVSMPSLEAIRNYLKLHWCLVALKEKKVFDAIFLFFPAVLSLVAWKLLIEAILFRTHRQLKVAKVRQIPLVN